MDQLLRETIWQFLKKPNTVLTHNPTIALLFMYLREVHKTYIHTKTCMLRFIIASFIKVPN